MLWSGDLMAVVWWRGLVAWYLVAMEWYSAANGMALNGPWNNDASSPNVASYRERVPTSALRLKCRRRLASRTEGEVWAAQGFVEPEGLEICGFGIWGWDLGWHLG